jgi:toxin CcdB
MANPKMQFDVHPNPIGRARRAFPLVAVLQSDLAETGRDRVVAFLAPRAGLPTATGRLMPIVRVGGEEFVLLVQSLTNLPVADLKSAVGNISTQRDSIIEALDWLFLGA